jgi:diguanylate cyclase (GGDEF)-like protein
MPTVHAWRRYRLIAVVVGILVSGFTLTDLLSYRGAVDVLKATILHNELPLTGSNIYSEIQADLIRPVFISSQMANDTFVQDWLLNGEKNEDQITRYLDTIKQKYGVFTSFLISDKTRHYYRFQGSRQDVSTTSPDDAWYFRCRAMKAPYEINIDFDLAANRTLTIFVNYRVVDSAGQFLGVTGVGLTLDSVRRVVDHYSADFHRNVYFFNQAGDITVGSTDAPPTGKSIKALPGLETIASRILAVPEGQFEYRRDGINYLLETRYVPELRWYVAVEQNQAVATEHIWWSFVRNLWIGLTIILVTALTIAYAVSRFNRRLDMMATTDKLTGIANRQLFDDTLECLLAPRRGVVRPFSLLLFDIDRFKRINDTLGHLRGDTVIRNVAQAAQASIGTTDLLCRWGGEEMIVLTRDCPLEEAAKRAEVLRAAIAVTPIMTPDDGTRVTVSIGVTECRSGDTSDSILSRADWALYRAKQDGRDCVRLAGRVAAGAEPDAVT